MICFPNCKINIGLNVVSERPDGYHDIETVFYPVNLQDALEINLMKPVRRLGRQEVGLLRKQQEPAATYADEQVVVNVRGIELDSSPADNLVVKAYRMLLEDFELPPIEINLFKHIPSGAGLGGGSSDCANMIMLLNRRFGLRMTGRCMERYAARLGADCAFFVRNTPVLATGIGDVMETVDLSLRGYTLLLVKPEVNVSTKEAYSKVIPGRPKISLAEAITRPVTRWRGLIENDFEKSVFSLYPQLGDIKEKLYSMGAVYSAMSGSGSTIYGIFNEPLANPEEQFPGMTVIQRALL